MVWARVLGKPGWNQSVTCRLPRCLELATGLVSLFRQLHERVDDPGVVFIGLGIYEKSVCYKSLDSGRRATESRRGRADDGHRAELLVQEVGWFGHDQVGLQSVSLQGFRIRLPLGSLEVRKRHGRVV